MASEDGRMDELGRDGMGRGGMLVMQGEIHILNSHFRVMLKFIAIQWLNGLSYILLSSWMC